MDATKIEKGTPTQILVSKVKGYIEIARIDHWFKNVFMFFGVLIAVFNNPLAIGLKHLPILILAILSTCLLASSNYVLNEIQDAKFDKFHPKKKYRPIPSGCVEISAAYFEWLALAAIGLALAFSINSAFFYTSLTFWVMGILYNVSPIRLKDIPYLDVLSESVNNPLRLLLGWFAIYPSELPSVSLLLAYWLIGAFFMASKRFSEYRHINDSDVAAEYRKSFRYYEEKTLLVSMFFYATLFGLFFGIFILRYHFELILMTPLIAGFISYYVKISFNKESAVQSPERLYREKVLMAYAGLCVLCFFILLFVNIPIMYKWFNVSQPQLPSLWVI
jgi:4-hydroxybenzoate polyprenyltransferase